MIDPITREEMFLSALAGNDIQLPDPITRAEIFLSEACENVQRDRAALVDLVDGGAKNLIDVSLKNVTGSYWDIPIAEIPAGVYVVSIGSLTSTDTDATTCNVRFGKSGSGIFGSNQCERGTDVHVTITIDNPADYMRIYYSDTNTHSTGDSITVTDLMVCTKSAWDISRKYVPYRPSYQELYEMVLALQ